MNTCFYQFGLRWLMSSLAVLTWSANVEQVSGQSSSANENPHTYLFREIETSIKVEPGSTVVEFTITNRSQNTRYVLVPLDLTPYRIRLTTKEGTPVAMTQKGRHDLSEPAAGSVRGISLETGVPWTYKIDLGPLFYFPKGEDVRCEVSRHVRFNHPDIKPGDIEWIPFPPVNIRSGSPVSTPTTESALELQGSAKENTRDFVEPSAGPSIRSDAFKNGPAIPPGQTPTSSTPWSVIVVVLVVAATGLLWLLVKKRN